MSFVGKKKKVDGMVPYRSMWLWMTEDPNSLSLSKSHLFCFICNGVLCVLLLR